MRAFLVILAYLLFYAIATRYHVMDYIKAFVLYILVFFLYCYMLMGNGKFRTLLDAYTDVLIVIGFTTVFFWLFGSVLGIIPYKTMTYHWTGNVRRTYNYFYLYFENPLQNQKLLGTVFPRNCGIFTEAPAYSGVLLYAIGIELYSRETVNKRRLIPLLITVLTVQSTKGYIILIVLFGIHYLTKEVKGRSRFYKIIRMLVSVLLIAALCFGVWYILEDKSSTRSYSARINHLMSGIRTWLQNPLFGAGFKNKNVLVENQEEGSGYGGTSMGLTILLAYGGLYLFGFYIYSYFYALRNPTIQKNRKNYNFYVLLALMNLFVSNSGFGYPYLFMISAAYAAGAQVSGGNRRAWGKEKLVET